MTIAALRAETDAGGAIDAVMERNRVFFREKTATARAVRTWSPERIAVAIDRIRTTERAILENGRATCRARVGQYVSLSVGAGSLNNKRRQSERNSHRP